MNAKTKKHLLKAIGSNLAAARHRAELTQATVAKRAGISTAYLSLLERGARNAPSTTLVELAQAVACEPSRILHAV